MYVLGGRYVEPYDKYAKSHSYSMLYIDSGDSGWGKSNRKYKIELLLTNFFLIYIYKILV